MASWKKVIVSGSAAQLASLQLDTPLGILYGGTGTASIGTDNFWVGSGATTVTHVGSNGTGTVVRSTAATGVTMSGSFSGSYIGNGSGLTGVLADSTIKISGSMGGGDFSTTETIRFTTQSVHGFDFTVTDANPFLVKLTTPQDLRSSASPTFESIALNGGSVTSDETTFNLLTGTVTTLNIGKGDTTIRLSGSAVVQSAVTASTAMLTGLSGLTTDTVLVISSNNVGTRAIDTRVWGTSLIDGAGANTRVAYFSDADTLTSNAGFTFDGSQVTIGNSTFGTNTRIAGNLIIAGTASFEHANSILVSDRFILVNSGSSTGDGGFIVQSGSSAVGSAFVWDDSVGRFGFQVFAPLSASATAATPDAYVAAVVDVDGGLSNIATYQKNGNIRIESGDIYIYS